MKITFQEFELFNNQYEVTVKNTITNKQISFVSDNKINHVTDLLHSFTSFLLEAEKRQKTYEDFCKCYGGEPNKETYTEWCYHFKDASVNWYNYCEKSLDKLREIYIDDICSLITQLRGYLHEIVSSW